MKKVRFQSPVKMLKSSIDELECQSPRPFIDAKGYFQSNTCHDYLKLMPYKPDPVQRFECSDSIPYPLANKTSIETDSAVSSKWLPSNELELSMLDSSCHEPRKPLSNCRQVTVTHANDNYFSDVSINCTKGFQNNTKVLSSIENIKKGPHNIENNNFFIKRTSGNYFNNNNNNTFTNQFQRLSLGKENDPSGKKAEIMKVPSGNSSREGNYQVMTPGAIPSLRNFQSHNQIIQNINKGEPLVNCRIQNTSLNLDSLTRLKQPDNSNNTVQGNICHCHHCLPIDYSKKLCDCNKRNSHSPDPHNTLDKKAWYLQKYTTNKSHDCMEVEEHQNVTKEKREPTVTDLFKIIKLQNEQLQLLQEKVDKFISARSSRNVDASSQNCMTEHIALEAGNNNQEKISIGVMTSFEMVRTSTVINKEILTQTSESGQIQCNRSQISIKEVVSKSQPVNLNFLEGIIPVGQNAILKRDESNKDACDFSAPDIVNDDKTVNDLSLFNVHVDNAVTPLISPEQSLYLDVQDYSGSDSGSDDQSNVGWTYYNKVMTHVNGMLQDSEMPSSASAMYRNTRQKCVQMQIDKTNVSVTKRVKFGDDPISIRQPHIYAASTDTSLKMNQLAAKYLKGRVPSPPPQHQITVSKPMMPMDMSFATRNYMERHRLLQGNTVELRSPPHGEIPKILDITALKQQPKLL